MHQVDLIHGVPMDYALQFILFLLLCFFFLSLLFRKLNHTICPILLFSHFPFILQVQLRLGRAYIGLSLFQLLVLSCFIQSSYYDYY